MRIFRLEILRGLSEEETKERYLLAENIEEAVEKIKKIGERIDAIAGVEGYFQWLSVANIGELIE